MHYDQGARLQIADLYKRIVNLEQQVANQAKLFHDHLVGVPRTQLIPVELKSQAAAAQATEHLYAPLRSDTKPLLEMSAFVRLMATTAFQNTNTRDGHVLALRVREAQEILKRST